MCRFTIYKGKPKLIGEVVVDPENSLLKQSRDAAYHPGVIDTCNKRNILVNGDGFGLSWYGSDVSKGGCCFKFVTPAWSDTNLRNIGEHVSSQLIFAHVRAANSGHDHNEQSIVSIENCHPFTYKAFTFMHNGGIPSFSKVKRRIIDLLGDVTYDNIKGTTSYPYNLITPTPTQTPNLTLYHVLTLTNPNPNLYTTLINPPFLCYTYLLNPPSLCDQHLLNPLEGSTDSEHIFALFLECLPAEDLRTPCTALSDMVAALNRTICIVESLCVHAGMCVYLYMYVCMYMCIKPPSYVYICIKSPSYIKPPSRHTRELLSQPMRNRRPPHYRIALPGRRTLPAPLSVLQLRVRLRVRGGAVLRQGI
jgi:predicted glutamine amidotransferase